MDEVPKDTVFLGRPKRLATKTPIIIDDDSDQDDIPLKIEIDSDWNNDKDSCSDSEADVIYLSDDSPKVSVKRKKTTTKKGKKTVKKEKSEPQKAVKKREPKTPSKKKPAVKKSAVRKPRKKKELIKLEVNQGNADVKNQNVIKHSDETDDKSDPGDKNINDAIKCDIENQDSCHSTDSVELKENFENIRRSFGLNERRWTTDEVISEILDISCVVSQDVIKLLDQNCTIPFIARYRKEKTGGLPPEKLREIQETYETIKAVQKKSENVTKAIARENKLTPELAAALYNAKSFAEIELLYAPYKVGGKKTLAERARKLGLEEAALKILNKQEIISCAQKFIQPNTKGLSSEEEVKTGFQNIIADVIAKDRDVLDNVRKCCPPYEINISSTKSLTAEKNDRQAFVEGTKTNNFKYENYYKFQGSAKSIKPHQILGINRGENQKVLTVKVGVSERAKSRLLQMTYNKFLHGRMFSLWNEETFEFVKKCIEDAYKRLLEPHICRQMRSELTKKAEKESVLVFCSNLKRLLLTPPVRGKVVMGIDPGFTHGCKLAIVSHTGALLCTDVIYPFSSKDRNFAANKLFSLAKQYKCETFAVGNGTACRNMEAFLSQLIKERDFRPLNPKFCIINEDGVSIYSVTKEAEQELPNLDPNLRSAVGIARRLQDPMLEYVKVEPKHLGIGMYQHDIPENMMKNALNEVVVECVSFVGVDLNVCPEVVLRKISGLTVTRAKNIIQWREENGPFQNRQQLLSVKGFGPKSFEQCAGFVKILPQTCIKHTESFGDLQQQGTSGKRKLGDDIKPAKAKRKKMDPIISNERNPLDMTVIHPESYSTAEWFLRTINASTKEIGEKSLIEKVKTVMKTSTVEKFAEQFNVPVPTMQLIIDSLQQPVEYDIRSEFEEPMFRRGIISLHDLQCGVIVTGKVTNTVHFGAFVDIGVECNGLVHISKMKGQKLALGDRIKVKVLSVDEQKKRIALGLEEKL